MKLRRFLGSYLEDPTLQLRVLAPTRAKAKNAIHAAIRWLYPDHKSLRVNVGLRCRLVNPGKGGRPKITGYRKRPKDQPDLDRKCRTCGEWWPWDRDHWSLKRRRGRKGRSGRWEWSTECKFCKRGPSRERARKRLENETPEERERRLRYLARWKERQRRAVAKRRGGRAASDEDDPGDDGAGSVGLDRGARDRPGGEGLPLPERPGALVPS